MNQLWWAWIIWWSAQKSHFVFGNKKLHTRHLGCGEKAFHGYSLRNYITVWFSASHILCTNTGICATVSFTRTWTLSLRVVDVTLVLWTVLKRSPLPRNMILCSGFGVLTSDCNKNTFNGIGCSLRDWVIICSWMQFRHNAAPDVN